jgi:hypothetical protein
MPRTKRNAYEDVSLVNLPGETWKSPTLLEDYYMVSSHGRIKSLPREHFIVNRRSGKTHYYYTKERIRKIKVHRRWNSFIGKPYYECTVALYMGGIVREFIVHRLVYQAFVSQIDFDKDALSVTHKDGDGLNNHFSNLTAKSVGEVHKRSYRLKRRVSPFATKTKKEIKDISRKSAVSRQKKVIQYSLEGKRLRVFDSIQEASLHVGGCNLVPVLKGRALTSGGFIWRYYPGPAKIAVAHILERKANKSAKQRKAIRQYSLAGKPLKDYKSITEASAQSNISISAISNCLAGRLKTAGGYKWRHLSTHSSS